MLNKLASQNTLLMKRHHRRKESTNTNSVPESRDGASTDSSNDPTLESVIERVRCDKNLITEMFDLDLSLNDESKKRKLKTVIISNEKVGTAKSNMDSWKKLKTQVILNKDPKISSMITNLTNQNDQLTENKPKVPTITEPPPKYFFKLLRDAFKRDTSKKCFNLAEIESNLKHEFAKLDIIYTFSQDVIRKALDFLKGVVPVAQVVFRLDEKEEPTLWEWSGTDSVNELMLSQLCEKWCNELARNQRMDSQYIPLAICPTTWTVRSSTMEEKQLFRQQETKRYETPHRPYTYYQHGYASVVGPVKGCILVKDATIHYNSSNKARDHSMLIKDRPTFVTLLSIVRDAVARLPNGEGTKADIGELLKDSQFLLDSITDQQLNAILARNLDRLHGERDSCVKFDPSRRLWIYLHRNRSEKDFERLHRMQLEANKVRRPAARAQKTKPAIAAVLNKKVITTTTSSSLSPAPPSYSSSISITKANFESALLVNADGSAHSVVNASLQQTDPLKNDKDSAIGTLVPISLNSDANLNSVQVVKLKKAAVPKRKLIDHLSSLSLTSEQLRTVEVENKEIGTSNSMQTKAVKLKTSKKTMKKLHPDSSNGFTPATGNDCNKPVSVSCNLTNANIGNVFHVNSNSAGKTAVIITKPMAKGSNTTAIKLPKQIQIQTQPSNNNSSVTHRISIPTSMLFNANGGPVVLGMRNFLLKIWFIVYLNCLF